MPPSKERLKLIEDAVGSLRRSIQKIDMVEMCDLLIQGDKLLVLFAQSGDFVLIHLPSVHYFIGIVDLALSRAQKEDPKNLALIAYRKRVSGLEEADSSTLQEAANASKGRSDAYEVIIDILDLFYRAITSFAQSDDAATFPSADCILKLSPDESRRESDAIMQRVFESDDELGHVAIFRWLISHGMADALIEVHVF